MMVSSSIDDGALVEFGMGFFIVRELACSMITGSSGRLPFFKHPWSFLSRFCLCKEIDVACHGGSLDFERLSDLFLSKLGLSL